MLAPGTFQLTSSFSTSTPLLITSPSAGKAHVAEGQDMGALINQGSGRLVLLPACVRSPGHQRPTLSSCLALCVLNVYITPCDASILTCSLSPTVTRAL